MVCLCQNTQMNGYLWTWYQKTHRTCSRQGIKAEANVKQNTRHHLPRYVFPNLQGVQQKGVMYRILSVMLRIIQSHLINFYIIHQESHLHKHLL